jgi:uncharacterized protein (TIGR01319 family)
LFHNLDTLKTIAERQVLPVGFEEAVDAMCRHNSVPEGDDQTACHLLLSSVAVRSAVDRHAGSVKTIITPNGEVTLQRGKDLTQVGWLIGAGGPVSFSADPRAVLAGALFEPGLPNVLKPKAPEMLLDEQYVLFALGLLAQSEPVKALRLMRKYVVPLAERRSTAPVRGKAEERERSGEHVPV